MQTADWLSINDYAIAHGVSRRTVYKWLGAALLETYRVEHLVRVKNQPPRQETALQARTAQPVKREAQRAEKSADRTIDIDRAAVRVSEVSPAS